MTFPERATRMLREPEMPRFASSRLSLFVNGTKVPLAYASLRHRIVLYSAVFAPYGTPVHHLTAVAFDLGQSRSVSPEQ